MKQNADGKTVAAVDLEVPGAGELMGGSEREADYDKLVNRMNELGMSFEGLDWYVNLRKFGGCVHSGFGMGFESTGCSRHSGISVVVKPIQI